MRVRLDQIGDEPFAWSERWQPALADLAHPDVVGVSEVEAKGQITPLQSGYHLRASLDYHLTLRCVRCLETFQEDRGSRLELLVVIATDETQEADEQELADDDLSTLRLSEPTLDTRPLWLEQLQLDIPMRPLCRDDCPGLCPSCGAPLAQGPCGCPAPTDSRWAALAALRERSPDSTD